MTDTFLAPLILVVEDEPDLRRDILEELQEAGYRTLAAQDGETAMAFLSGITPDLVLCDITMPRLDGYELLSAMRRERPSIATTPFVFLTAMSEPQEVIKGKLQGADDYLVKPVDYDLLLATISARLRQVDRIRGQQEREISNLRMALGDLSTGVRHPVLDLIALGVVLLNGEGRVVHANRAAQEMAQDASFLTIRNDRLRAVDPDSNTTLHRTIKELKEVAPDTENITGVLLHRADQSTSVLIAALDIAESRDPNVPQFALFLSPPAHEKRVSEKLLIDLFDLTPTEARVAGLLSRGVLPSEVADELGVSSTTIAFHIRNLLQKTGTNRQADLIALILAGPMAVGAM
ncbi:response regulator [Celeribacter sp.]|uniref:response regulator n=1 Tax=Celeribacter sp. TaxID=1890673 RepID=UPI003A94353A